MRRSLLLLFALLVGASLLRAQTECACNYLGTAVHKRQTVKDCSPSGSASTGSTVANVLSMKISAVEKKSIKDSPDKPVAREKESITVTGYVWIMKVADEDCDLHFEISATDSKKAKRIIVEIPNTSEYCDFRAKVWNGIISKYKLHPKKAYHFDENDNGGKSFKITVTGKLFWDSGHPTNENHGSEHVGSVWEIHPVSKMNWK